MRTRIKFCGFTRIADAHAAVALGVDAIGLVLTPRSKRCIAPLQAREIHRALPPFVTAVALFMDDEPGFIADAIATVQPDLLQFHGSETLEDCVRYDVPYLKAIAMSGSSGASDEGVVRALHEHSAALGFLFDAHAPGGQGGSGSTFDWTHLPRDLARPLVLAGGLNAGNVGTAIQAVRPYAVDVSSGIETAPGIKDVEKMQQFVEAVRAADAQPR